MTDAVSLSPIIPPQELAALVDAETMRVEAEAALEAARAEAGAIRQTARREGFAEGLVEAAAAAQNILDAANEAAKRQAAEVEDTLAGLVADVVRRILGAQDRDASVRAALANALGELGGKGAAQLHVAADMVAPAQAAARDAPQIVAVRLDEGLSPGECVFSSEDVHVRVGLEALTEAALAPFEGEP